MDYLEKGETNGMGTKVDVYQKYDALRAKQEIKNNPEKVQEKQIMKSSVMRYSKKFRIPKLRRGFCV